LPDEQIPPQIQAWSALEPEVQAALKTEVDRALARRAITGALVYFFVNVIVALSTSYFSDHPFILSITSGCVLITGITRIISARFLLRELPAIRPATRWLFIASTYATVIIWGGFCAATVYLYQRDWNAMFILLNTAALAAGATSSLAPDQTLARRCLVCLMAPAIIASFLLREAGYAAFGLVTTIYLGFLIVQVRGNWWAFWSASVAAERERIRGSAERRRAEAERATLVTAMEQTAEEILITDTEGRIQYCNAAFLTITGYSRNEVIGRNLRFLKSGQHDNDYYDEVWKTILEGHVWGGKFINRRKNGSLYHTEGTIAPVYDETGNLTGFVSARHDITDRLRLESELLQAQKMESIGRLAGGVAHDFNNLLTVITGYSGLVESELDLTDRRRQYVKEIRVAGERAATLTRQLLAFSRKQTFRPVRLDLNRFTEDMCGMIQRLVGEDVKVETRLHPGLRPVSADPDQISQILLNLAANARDAMPDGGRLIVRTANVAARDGAAADAHPESVLLAVTDTGVGISEEHKQHLFEPFFTTKPRGRGTGLGLSMVYGIVQQSGGWIDVFSEPGKGTTFSIYLPALANAPAPETMSEPTRVPRVNASGTVLVVEDDDEVRGLVKTVLESDGFRVLEAAGGQAALTLVRDYPGKIDLLITDVIMPEMTGKQLVDELRPLCPGVKILYMSGYSGDVLARRGILDAHISYLAKPFSPGSLSANVREVLRPQQPGSPPLSVILESSGPTDHEANPG
jgi:PAS domain S-box-containing protein